MNGNAANHSGPREDANDPLLRDVLESATEKARDAAILELLAAQAYPRIDAILGARFRRSGLSADHQDDLRADILLKLVSRLRRLAGEPDSRPVERFADYVAVVAFHAFDDFVRGAFPLRTKLKNRIRYALRNDGRFALWAGREALLCGLAQWNGRAAPFRVDEESIAVDAGAELGDMLADLFRQAGAPLELEWVVSRIAATQTAAHEGPLPFLDAATHRQPGADLENLQTLRALWDEIVALPRHQRTALLLGARDADGESVTHSLPMTGVATIRQIAATLELDAGRLAELWPELPLDDDRIGVLLALTRQQVINARRSARDRLVRRLRRSVR